MGYDTDFDGQLTVNKPFKHWTIFYINQFSETRHMIRDIIKIPYNDANKRHWLLKIMNLPIGIGGEYYLPISEPTINCSIKNFKDFIPEFQKTIITLFCIHKFHYKQFDKNLFVLIANRLIRGAFIDSNNNIMITYECFYNCIKPISNISDSHKSSDILNYNEPASTQPGLWCQWTVLEKSLFWDGSEKFHNYREWLEYLIENFFKRWDYTLNGLISFQGEYPDDRGYIKVHNNMVDIVEMEQGYDGDGY
jgi:hypothetical protein